MILSYIRKSQLHGLVWPLILIAITIFLTWRSPVADFVTMKDMDNAKLIDDDVAERVLYARVKTQRLYYTGLDCWDGSDLIGHYYYELENGVCHFYLIRAAAGYPAAQEIENQTVIGRIDAFDGDILQGLADKLAKSLDWNSSSIQKVSQMYFINETAYLSTRILVLMAVLSVVFAAMSAITVINILYIINPWITPTLRRLERYGDAGRILRDVERQIRHEKILQTRTITLTRSYLVEMADGVCVIIPLNEVLWIYDHAAMHHGLKGKCLNYTIHIVTARGDEYTMRGKSHKEVDTIYHELSTRFPNYFFGYSREQEEMVKYITAELKAGKYRERKAKRKDNTDFYS